MIPDPFPLLVRESNHPTFIADRLRPIVFHPRAFGVGGERGHEVGRPHDVLIAEGRSNIAQQRHIERAVVFGPTEIACGLAGKLGPPTASQVGNRVCRPIVQRIRHRGFGVDQLMTSSTERASAKARQAESYLTSAVMGSRPRRRHRRYGALRRRYGDVLGNAAAILEKSLLVGHVRPEHQQAVAGVEIKLSIWCWAPRSKLIKIGARVVSHGRYIIFQMAEVAIARQMFQEILRLIAELRPQPPPALA
jgi:hypothetical protein